MGLLPLAFSSPFVLLALASLPALWLLLRITPPRPRAIDFPPLKLILDLLPREETPARTPWWLLALRLAIAGLVIFAMAGPVWNERQEGAGGSGPLLLVLDSGWGAAADWTDRMSLAEEVIRGAERANRPVALLPTGERPTDITLGSASKTLEKLRSVQPAPFTPARASHLPAIEAFLAREPAAEVNWISDGIASADEAPFVQRLGTLAKGRSFAIFAAAKPATVTDAAPHDAVVQTMAIVYTHVHGVPLSRSDRPGIGWYGDMEMGSHAWELLGSGPIDVRIKLGTPKPLDAFADRKALAKYAEEQVRADVTALLRGRPAGTGN